MRIPEPTPVCAGDIDGNGIPEIITLEKWAPSYLPGGATTTVIALLRYELAGDQLAQVQRFEVTVPIAEPFVRFIALGDVDDDGFADVGILRRLARGFSSIYPGVQVETGVAIDVIRGGPLGFTQVSTIQFPVPDADRPSAGGTPLVRGIGDFDGDGFSDLALGQELEQTDTCAQRPRGYVDILRGSPTADFAERIARIDGYTGAEPLGDIDGDGLADIGMTRDPADHIGPIAPSTNCAGAYMLIGLDPGDANIVFGGASASPRSVVWTMPEETETGCTNGWHYTDRFPVHGTLAAGGDLDGDGYDDFVLVSPETYPGGGIACVPGGARIRVLNGSAAPTGFAVSQILAGPGDALVNFASIVRIGGPDGPGGDHLLVASQGRADASKYTMIPRSVSVYTGA